MITDTRPALPAEHESDSGFTPVDLAELSSVGVALVALVLTIGVVWALLNGHPGLGADDVVIVSSLWLLAATCWRSRTRAAAWRRGGPVRRRPS